MHRSALLLLLTGLAVFVPFSASAAHSEEAVARANALLASWGSGPGSPGCSAAVVLHDETVWSGVSGQADLEHGTPIAPATMFDAGSVAKPVTALAILLLEREGKLSLDDPISRHLPDLPAVYAPVRVRHLLMHTSGVREWQDLLHLMAGWRRDDEVRTDDVLRVLRAQRGLNFTPGARVQYVSSNYVLLGQIVRQISEVSLPEFVRTRVFEPLEMRESRVVDDHTALIRGVAEGYQTPAEGVWELVPRTSDLVGSGHLYTTAGDLVKLFRASTQSPWREMLARMRTPGVLSDGRPAVDDAGHAAGLGLWIQTQAGHTLIGHTGVTHGTHAAVYLVPETGAIVALLCNRQNDEPQRAAMELLDVFTHEGWATAFDTRPAESSPVERPASELARFAGVYQQPSTRVTQRFVATADGLHLGSSAGRRVLPLADGRNALADAPGYRVQFDTEDGVARLKLWNMGARDPESYERISSEDRYAPTQAEIGARAGCYVSPELGAWGELQPGSEGMLRSVDSKGRVLEFRAVLPDLWRSGNHMIEVQHGKGGTIRGFYRSAELAWRVWFERSACPAQTAPPGKKESASGSDLSGSPRPATRRRTTGRGSERVSTGAR